VRRLRALQRISELVDSGVPSQDDLFREVARALPSGFRRLDRIGVRITHGDAVYTHRYRETPQKIVAGIRVDGQQAGSVEVVYLAGSLPRPKTTFSADEECLLQVIADMLGRALRRRSEDERYRSFIRDFRGSPTGRRQDPNLPSSMVRWR
jgi:hypothetical protein